VSIIQTLNDDMKAALRAGSKLELGALRMALAAIKKQEIDGRETLTDGAVVSLLGKLIKQGRDAEQQFRTAGRAELADKEAAEIEIFERYMPTALTAAETEALIRAAIQSTGASDVKDMGRVMTQIKQEAAGRVDLGQVGGQVRKILSSG